MIIKENELDGDWQRRLWILNVTCIALSLATFLEDRTDLVLRCLVVGIIPLICQMHLVYSSRGGCCKRSVKAKLALISSTIGVVLCIIIIALMAYNMIKNKVLRAYLDKGHVESHVLTTWNIMYGTQTSWILFGYIVSLLSNLIFMRHLLKVYFWSASHNYQALSIISDVEMKKVDGRER